MSDHFVQFHYHASQVPHQFDFGAENFDVKDIYRFYQLKHEKTGVSAFIDQSIGKSLRDFSTTPQEYESLYVKSKTVANLAQTVFNKGAQ